MRRRRVANEGRQREVGFCNKGWKLGERGREKVREKEGWIEGCAGQACGGWWSRGGLVHPGGLQLSRTQHLFSARL